MERGYTAQHLKVCDIARPSPATSCVCGSQEWQHLAACREEEAAARLASDAAFRRRVAAACGMAVGCGSAAAAHAGLWLPLQTQMLAVLLECNAVHCMHSLRLCAIHHWSTWHICSFQVLSTASCCSACDLTAAIQAREILCHWQKAQSNRLQQDWGSGVLKILCELGPVSDSILGWPVHKVAIALLHPHLILYGMTAGCLVSPGSP